MATKKNYYFRAQLAFWGSYFLLNLLFMRLWGAQLTPFLIGMFLYLSIALGLVSHGFRYLYKRFAPEWSLLKTSLQLLWLIPLSALLTQLIVSTSIFLFIASLPDLAKGAQPVNAGGLLGYTLNYCILFGLWSAIYLLRAEFYKRRNSEIAYWKLQAQLKENELQFLRSQINSHFLFNAINNLRSLINEDPKGARDGLANLSVLLRGLLQSNDQQLVCLRDELEWVKGYLSLEALQFENRLTTSMSVDDDLLTQKLPPLILQTLVENAIKHGIAARRAGGHLDIKISKLSPTHWQIHVENPLPEFQSTHQGNGIGLRNARERLELAFDKNASLSLEINGKVTATVEIPL